MQKLKSMVVDQIPRQRLGQDSELSHLLSDYGDISPTKETESPHHYYHNSVPKNDKVSSWLWFEISPKSNDPPLDSKSMCDSDPLLSVSDKRRCFGLRLINRREYWSNHLCQKSHIILYWPIYWMVIRRVRRNSENKYHINTWPPFGSWFLTNFLRPLVYNRSQSNRNWKTSTKQNKKKTYFQNNNYFSSW
jgi:hypothetical protein